MPHSPPPLPPEISPSSEPTSDLPARRRPSPAFGRVNLILILGSVLVTLLSSLGEDRARLLPLFISLYPANSAECLLEVRHGEVWRLFTPAFIHFGIVHLSFNMMGMKNIGDAMEHVHGWRFYLFLTATLALCSNLGQYLVSGSPGFGGMSGVLYGLFGFLWMRGLSDRAYPLRMTRQSIVLSLVWFAACFTGVLPIANGAHATGLALGSVWGLVAGRRAAMRFSARMAHPIMGG